MSTSAQINSWINAGSGNWDQPSFWSLGILPDSSQSVLITNVGWKAVAINPSTAVNFPDSMTVSNLTIRGAANTENTLLLNYLGTNVPLTVLNGLTVADGGQILNFNSGLVVQSGAIVVTNAQIIQDGGFVNFTNASLYLANSEYDITNGVFDSGLVMVGAPASGHFNQYGGVVTITALGFGRALTGPSGGAYALYGGNLYLPSGLMLFGDNGAAVSYFQADGTNQTTEVMMEAGLFGSSPSFTLNGGLLADNDVSILGDDFGAATLTQNGGTHVITNLLKLSGGSTHGETTRPGTYSLGGGTLSAGAIILASGSGDAVFIQTNGVTHTGQIQADGDWNWKSEFTLAGGMLGCAGLSSTNGANIHQYGGVLVISNSLVFGGYREPGPKIYSRYELIDGTLSVSNIIVDGDWIIGDSSRTNRITNPGSCSLSHTLQIGNAIEQLGRFILVSNAIIDLVGSASRLSFANSSAEIWNGSATLVVSDWNGNPSGGGAEQLKFGTDQNGLTLAQLGQIQFSVGTNLYPAKILGTGEIVPDQGSSTSGLVNSWINPGDGNWDTPANWSLGILPNIAQSILITNTGWKAIAINPSTPNNFPDSMTVSNLIIRGATNTENTLLLNYFGTNVPLTVVNGLTLQDDAQILNFNSGLVVQGGTITVTNSQINQDGGFINTTNATMFLSDSIYNLTNGVFEAGSVLLGNPAAAHFNQYGGSVIITNLEFASYIYGTNVNGYSLYGGTLDLPAGMSLFGGPGGAGYFQSGGTNRTTRVFLEPEYGGFVSGFTLNGGLLADSSVELRAGYRAPMTIVQNGGLHVITNSLLLVGSAPNGYSVDPATYYLNGGTLAAGVIELAADDGDSVFVQQSNSIVSAGTIFAHSEGFFSGHNTGITLSDGTLSCSNFTTDDGGCRFNQTGGALVISNLLDFSGSRYVGITIYGRYTFTGGTVTASNINVAADWVIGDGNTNRITNAGFCRLSHMLQISNAVEQLGRFILASNALIDLAGNASQLSFSNSSAETWANSTTLVVSDWNGNPSGGGTEQLKFGTNETGLTPAQLSQIQFRTNNSPYLYSAKILPTGEVVPDQIIPPSVTLSTQGTNLVLTWPTGWSLQTATTASGPYSDVTAAASPYATNITLEPQRFFRLRQ